MSEEYKYKPLGQVKYLKGSIGGPRDGISVPEGADIPRIGEFEDAVFRKSLREATKKTEERRLRMTDMRRDRVVDRVLKLLSRPDYYEYMANICVETPKGPFSNERTYKIELTDPDGGLAGF